MQRTWRSLERGEKGELPPITAVLPTLEEGAVRVLGEVLKEE